MALELIPVIEIAYSHLGIVAPAKYPYWIYPELWDDYNAACYEKAGFKDKLKPYLPGSSFYKLTDISDNNLIKLVMDQTEGLRSGKYTREECCGFCGGYVLRIDEEDKYFPQCCGEISDITYWEKLVTERKSTYYQGHPEPQVKIKGDNVTFDFRVEEFDEPFVPTPPETVITFEITSLKNAIDMVKPQLETFAERLKQITTSENLNIENIDNLLIFGEFSNSDF